MKTTSEKFSPKTIYREKRNFFNFLVFLFIFFFVLLLNISILKCWFVWDDLSCIYAARKINTFSLFFTKKYLIFNKFFYTPILPFSFKVDNLFANFYPLYYRLHNVLAAAFSSFLVYLFSRRYLSFSSSIFVSILFACSLPVVFDVFWITRRHYLWGFNFSLISFLLFCNYCRTKRSLLVFLSYIFCILSFLCKEAYLTLPFFIVLYCLTEKISLSKTWPYFLILFLYFLLRFSILGYLGGYPSSFAQKSKKEIKEK